MNTVTYNQKLSQYSVPTHTESVDTVIGAYKTETISFPLPIITNRSVYRSGVLSRPDIRPRVTPRERALSGRDVVLFGKLARSFGGKGRFVQYPEGGEVLLRCFVSILVWRLAPSHSF